MAARVLHPGHLSACTRHCVSHFASPPCCCGGDAAVTAQRRGCLESSVSAWTAHFLLRPSSPLTALQSFLMNECPSCLLHQGQSPASLCTCLGVRHGSRAGTAPACDGQVEQSNNVPGSLCLPSFLPHAPAHDRSNPEGIYGNRPYSTASVLCKIHPVSLPVPSQLFVGLLVESFSPSAGVTQPISGHNCWGTKSLPWGVSKVVAPLHSEPLTISVASGLPGQGLSPLKYPTQLCPGCPGRHHAGVLQQPRTRPPRAKVGVCTWHEVVFLLHPSVSVQEHKPSQRASIQKSPFSVVFAPHSAGIGLAQPGTCPWALVSWCLQRPSQCLVCQAGARGLCGSSSGLAQGGSCSFCRQSTCSSVPGTFPVACDA